jgi:hypothetical protein
VFKAKTLMGEFWQNSSPSFKGSDRAIPTDIFLFFCGQNIDLFAGLQHTLITGAT